MTGPETEVLTELDTRGPKKIGIDLVFLLLLTDRIIKFNNSRWANAKGFHEEKWNVEIEGA